MPSGVRNCVPLVCIILQVTLLSGYYRSRFPYKETGLEVNTSQAQKGQGWCPAQTTSRQAHAHAHAVERRSHTVGMRPGRWMLQCASFPYIYAAPFTGSGVTSHGSRASSGSLPDCAGPCGLRMVLNFLQTGSSKRIIFCDSEMI